MSEDHRPISLKMIFYKIELKCPLKYPLAKIFVNAPGVSRVHVGHCSQQGGLKVFIKP